MDSIACGERGRPHALFSNLESIARFIEQGGPVAALKSSFDARDTSYDGLKDGSALEMVDARLRKSHAGGYSLTT